MSDTPDFRTVRESIREKTRQIPQADNHGRYDGGGLDRFVDDEPAPDPTAAASADPGTPKPDPTQGANSSGVDDTPELASSEGRVSDAVRMRTSQLYPPAA